MILSGSDIRGAIDDGEWQVFRDGVPVDSDVLTINGNSVNVSLGDKMLIPKWDRVKSCYVDLHDPDSISWQYPMESDRIDNEQFHILPRDFVLMNVRERFDCSEALYIKGRMRWFAPMIEGRSTSARCGLSIHACAGFGDYGFSGTFTIEVSSKLPIILRKGDEVAQVYFIEVSSPDHYQGAYTEQRDEPVAPALGKDRFQRH